LRLTAADAESTESAVPTGAFHISRALAAFFGSWWMACNWEFWELKYTAACPVTAGLDLIDADASNVHRSVPFELTAYSLRSVEPT
jgi:hypothetical protein